MSLEFYFLRSSEQKIVTDMLYYAQQLDEQSKELDDLPHLKIYNDFYGLTRKDLGIYVMQESVVCGAIWSRRLNKEHNSKGFVCEECPVLNIAIKPAFRKQGIGTKLMEQFLKEQSALSSCVSIELPKTPQGVAFLEKFGFEPSTQNPQVLLKHLAPPKEQKVQNTIDYSKWLD